jgi:RNA processing factor Prp31
MRPAAGAAQIDRFREKARELGCDEDEAAFDEKLRQIARHKPEPKAKRLPSKKPEAAR